MLLDGEEGPAIVSAVLHIAGARPNFMKAAPVVRALAARGIRQHFLHTGQHYDFTLSDVFFRDLELPSPDYHLGVGSGSHAQQTAALLTSLEPVLLDLTPSLVVVYGDVNSTLAGSLVAAKLGIPVAHVEAGLRSFDMTMPEEINRRVTDMLSDLLFVTSPEALDHLARESIDRARVHFVGNPMIDTLLANMERLDVTRARESVGAGERYAAATLHRPANVDQVASASRIVEALAAVAEMIQVVLPLHPRGRPTLEAAGLLRVQNLVVVDPMGYLEFISLVRGATLVITDSGGIQEETTILGIPCLTVRPNTERPVTVSHGTNRLVTPEGLPDAARDVLSGNAPQLNNVPPLWDGRAGERIADIILSWLDKRTTSPTGPPHNATVHDQWSEL